MTIRSVFLGLFVGTGLVLSVTDGRAADQFEIQGLHAGMSLDQVERAVEQQKLGTPKLRRAPSFEQEVALARKRRVVANEYDGVQTLLAENGSRQIEVFFVATPKGPVAAKITIEVYGGTSADEFSKKLVSKFGPPDRKSDRDWLWGDTGMFYARTKPYLEFQPKPVSATAPRPLARLILGDPAIQKQSREAIAGEARKGS